MGKTLVIYHNEYGCDSSCCGHTVEVDGDSAFSFYHPRRSSGETDREFAERILKEEFPEEHLADLDWANARIEVSDD